MATTGNQSAQVRGLVEEKFFNIRLGETGSLLKEALQDACGMELEELAPGMWVGSRQEGRWTSVELTARAQAVEDGTTVELRVEHRTSPAGMALFIFLIMFAAMALLPLIPIIWHGQKQQKQQQRDRLVMMHKMWTELAEVVGAPRKASYRDAPQRAYAPPAGARIATKAKARIAAPAPTEDDASVEMAEQDAAQAEAEAAEAEAEREVSS